MSVSFPLYVVGFPSLFGGAGAELFHQLKVWHRMHVDVHIIPTQTNVKKSQLYPAVSSMGVTIHNPYEWDCIPENAPVLSFCNEIFLENLSKIRKKTNRIVFANCMTWIFPKEKEAMLRGDIGMFLYQNETVRLNIMPQLQRLNSSPLIQYKTFKPYFDDTAFPFQINRPRNLFCAGHISRHDADKYTKDTWHIYESFDSPVEKHGVFLGFNNISAKKTGMPPDWIETYNDQKQLSQQEFYRRCHVILQPTDTTENWPRIGFEAMASGSVLIVNKRGGWQQMIQHGKTGWLCETTNDFIAYATKMAWEPNYREDIAAAARLKGIELGGMDAAINSWHEIFSAIDKMPERRESTPDKTILIGVFSHADAIEQRQAIRETWFKLMPTYCKPLFFIGGGRKPENEPEDIVVFDISDDCGSRAQKMFAFFQYALCQPSVKWFFKCEDNTYVHPGRLHLLIDERFDLIGDMSIKKESSPNEGAGYMLSRGFIEKLLSSNYSFGKDRFIIGEYAQLLGAKMLATSRLYHDCTMFPVPWNKLVSAHGCTPHIMKAIFKLAFL